MSYPRHPYSLLLAAGLLCGLALPGAAQKSPTPSPSAAPPKAASAEPTLEDLLKAVHQGLLPEVTRLLEKNPKLAKAVNGRGHSALFDAAYMNRADLANLLVARGADVNQATNRHTLPLHAAATRGSLEISTLLVLNGALVDVTDPDGRTPLHKASYGKHVEVVKLLLGKGANPKIRDLRGSTPLHLAARSGSPAAVDMLLAAGAEVDAKDNAGRTPLWHSQWGQHGEWEKTSQILVAKGAKAVPPRPAPKPVIKPTPTPVPKK